MKRSVVWVIVGVAIVALGLWAWLAYARAYAHSRSGDLEATVYSSGDKVKITMRSQAEEVALFGPEVGRTPGLTEIAWSEDRTSVGVLVCTADGRILTGYNVRTKQKLSAGDAAALVRPALNKRYSHIAQGDSGFGLDPVTWACSADGLAYFEGMKAKGLPVELPPQ
jgi:hypothetical protein